MNSIEKIVTQMGIISDEVYKDEYFNKNMTLIANSNEYSVVDYIDTRQDDSDSFSSTQALLLKNNITKDYIIAFRGTQEIPDYAIDFTLIPFLNLNPQYKIALNFTQSALEKISDDKQCSIEEAKQYLTLTGHSLGGILTQTIGANFHIKGYTYNPYGASVLSQDVLMPLPLNFIYAKMESLFESIGLSSNHFKWARDNIYNMSYQDEGAINGDFLSNLFTLVMGNHLGKFIPIFGKNVGAIDGHRISTLNAAISEYNDILKHFNSNVTYKELTSAYLATAIVHQGKGYETLQNEFKKLGVFEAADSSLSLDIITSTLNLQSALSPKHIPTPALYALIHLNPFIVSGIDSPAYKEFEKYKDEYSDNYVKDKAKMFEAALKYPDKKPVNFNYFDIETKKELYSNPAGNSDKETDVIFGVNLDETIQARPNFNNRIYALAGNDSIKGGKHDNYIEAGPGNDTIDLRSSKGKNTVYGGVNNGKDNDDDGDDTVYAGQEKDTIYGGNGKDTIYTDNDDKEDLLYGGDGFDTYYVGDKDIIFDSDGKGKVVFEGVELKGGTYDKDKGVYLSKDGLIEYRLNESGGKSTLTVQKGGKSITINEFSKEDKSLGIKLANSKVEVSVTNKEGGDRWLQESLGDRGLPFTMSLNRKLDKGEYLKVEVVTSMKGDKSIIEFKEGEGDISKDFNFTWDDDNYPQGNRSFVVNASVVDESSDLTAEVVSSARGMIKDDDRDPDNPNRPNNPDIPNDTFPDMTPASTKTSPIVIDLNGDGIKTISRKNGKTYFDLDNNKFAENTSWIDKNDGILINKTLIATNSITSGSELFGNHTLLRDGSLADNGFEALKEFDENKDSNDVKFTNLSLVA